MERVLVMMHHEDFRVRTQGLERLATEYFGRRAPIPAALEDALIGTLKSDPSEEVRSVALSRISADFDWWGDSPMGSINVDLLRRILSALPDAISGSPGPESVRAAGEIVGRLGSVRDLSRLPVELRTNRAFRVAMLDGLTRRELYGESEALLRELLKDPDPDVRRDAAELLEEV